MHPKNMNVLRYIPLTISQNWAHKNLENIPTLFEDFYSSIQ